MVRKLSLLASLVLLSSCISVTSNPVQSDEPITQVCIERNPKVIVHNFTDILQDALARHGITSKIYDTIPDNCAYHLTYVAYQMWDFVLFVSNAHIDLYKGDTVIASTDRHMPFGSGFDFSKWDSTRTKINEMVDLLLANNPDQ